MQSHLADLPIELIETLVTLLEVADIGSLRLTSRVLEQKASCGHFTTFFTHKDVKLTTQNLQNMVQLMCQSRLSRLLQHCTITGIARRPEEENSSEEGEHWLLLAEAFEILIKRSQRTGIASLCLRVVAMQPYNLFAGSSNEHYYSNEFHSWRHVWDAATHTFNVAIAALEESQLLVNEHVDIFGSVKGCSLSCDVFQNFAKTFVASTDIFRALRKLTLGLSAPSEHVRGNEMKAYDEDNENELTFVIGRFFREERLRLRNYPSVILRCIPRLLGNMPSVKSLDLHWYHIGNCQPDFPTSFADSDSKGHLSATVRLQECALRGIYTSDSDLLHFLKAVNPTALTLKHVLLAPGNTWDTVFDHLRNSESSISEYCLDDISVEYDLVHFENIPGVSKFRYRGEVMGPSTLTRSKSQAKQAIWYRFATGAAMSSGAKARWNQENSKEYGWPHLSRYDFIGLNALQKVVSSDLEDEED